MLKYYELLINSKITSLDRSNEEEINEYNDIIAFYRKTLFNEVAETLKDENGDKIDIDKIIENKKSLFKPIKAKLTKPLNEEFTSMDIKSLIKE